MLIVSEDVPEARSNDTATYLAQRTQLGSGNSIDPAEARTPRAAAEHAARNGRADGTALAEDAGALLATADNRALTTTAPHARDPVLRAAGQPDRRRPKCRC